MNLLDFIFPYIEPLPPGEAERRQRQLDQEVNEIRAANFSVEPEKALVEAQRAAAFDQERARTAEGKATTYLAVLAALVPIIITLQAATWEAKSGPAPTWLKFGLMLAAVVYLTAAGYHAFRTLKVNATQCVMEPEIVTAWKSPRPLQRMTRSTLLASRRSRDRVNEKVTRIKVAHEHLIRALAAFGLLLVLDPVFHLAGYPAKSESTKVQQAPANPASPQGTSPAVEAERLPGIASPAPTAAASRQPEPAESESVEAPNATNRGSENPNSPPTST